MKTIDVFWIASYPKSGNTWINLVIRTAGAKFGFPNSDMGISNIMRNGIVPETSLVVSAGITLDKCAVLKTHSAYPGIDKPMHLNSGYNFVNKGYIHIYRNPLDMLLSYINYTRLEYNAYREDTLNSQSYRNNLFKSLLNFNRDYSYEEWSEMTLNDIPHNNLDHALDFFSDNNLCIPSLWPMSNTWLNHTLSWIDANKDIPGVSIRYEDCLRDDEIIVNLSNFFIMRKNEFQDALNHVNSNSKKISISHDSSLHDKVFFNKMKSYYFKEYFSKSALTRFFKRHESILIKLKYGYLLEIG